MVFQQTQIVIGKPDKGRIHFLARWKRTYGPPLTFSQRGLTLVGENGISQVLGVLNNSEEVEGNELWFRVGKSTHRGRRVGFYMVPQKSNR